MIFVLSPGRCGTMYLSEMLALVPDISAWHEPEPNFSVAAAAALFKPELAARFWTERKLPAIRSVPEPVHVETSHLFAHSFAETLLEVGEIADIVVLTRPHREVALSMWRRNTIPGKTSLGIQYQMHPAAPTNVRPLANWQRLDAYQLCYWHCLEVAARSSMLARMYEGLGATVHFTTLDTLTTECGFWMLLDRFDLPMPNWEDYRQHSGQRVNANPDTITARMPSRDLDQLESDLSNRIGNHYASTQR